MAVLKVANNFYVADSITEVSTSLPEETLVAVRDSEVIAKYYKLISGTYEFQFNQEDSPLKQDVLISGMNIKTINGESILGSGDIPVDGGSGFQFVSDQSGNNVKIIFSPTEPTVTPGQKIAWIQIP